MSSRFFGREQELARLQQTFEQVAARDGKGRSVGGPRMAVILAHSGVGKTRLAQELYRWLASHPTWDAGDFWPDDFGAEKK
ncbi:MAG: ATP-binding protein, partial [Deltaproteobacteria bacterium]|nr:ATP-binding protein [Deltaproteobacteria bacterium]